MTASSPSNGSGDSEGSDAPLVREVGSARAVIRGHAPQCEVDAVGLHLDLRVDEPLDQRRFGRDAVEDGASIEQARHNVGVLYRLRGPLAKGAVLNGDLRVLA